MGDDPANPMTIHFILIIVLTLLNAFFAASEMAIVSIERSNLDSLAEEGHRRATKVLAILKEPSRFLSTVQIGITLASFFNVAIAARNITPTFAHFLEQYDCPWADQVAFILIVLFLCYLTLVFGEFVPKRMVVRSPEKFAFFAINIISPLAFLFAPLSKGLSLSTNTVLRLCGIDLTQMEERVTLESIRSMVEVGQEQGVINSIEREMIDSVISFDDKQAEEIMTARTEVFMIDIEDPLEDFVSQMLSLKFSRIPVYEDSPDNIIGILYLKDFLLSAYKHQSFDKVNIRGILRPAYFVPERKNINDLFHEMQSEHRHMALLIDEYGGFSGVVTMEDLIEEIMGDIDDEYDHDEPDIYRLNDNTYHVHGTISIKEFNSETGADIDEDSEDYDTIGGFIINTLDYIPENGDRPVVRTENMIFQVLKVSENRIKDIRVTILPTEEE